MCLILFLSLMFMTCDHGGDRVPSKTQGSSGHSQHEPPPVDPPIHVWKGMLKQKLCICVDVKENYAAEFHLGVIFIPVDYYIFRQPVGYFRKLRHRSILPEPFDVSLTDFLRTR